MSLLEGDPIEIVRARPPIYKEILAHTREYQVRTTNPVEVNRQMRRIIFKETAKRLSAPLYQYSLTSRQAEEELKNAISIFS